MYAFKDKVSEKLSRLFPESSTNSSSSSSSSNNREPKASSYSNGVKSLSSYFSYIIPGKGPDETGPKSHQQEYNLVPSESVRNKKQNPKCQVEISDTQETSSGSEGKRQTETNVDEKPSNSPPNPLSNLMDESAFISEELYEFLFSSIPNIVKGCQWILLYSTLRHGISLRTLIRKSADLSGPCLLIVGDKQGAVFGGLLECPLKPTPKRKYQGTNQSFVFTTIYGQPRLFRPTGANRYYYLCLDNLLALGGGGNFALCLDGDLLNGTSGPCETFGNVCLAHKPEFELKNVELWGFTHASQYLT